MPDTPPEIIMALAELETMNLALYQHLKAHGCTCKSVLEDPPKEEKK